jgi:kynurenine formamidase
MCTENCAGVSRRAALFGVGAAMMSGTALGTTALGGEPAQAAPARRRGRGLQDLTYPLTTTFPAYTPGEEPSREPYTTIENDGYYMQQWRILEHYGTHVDAPAHFAPGARTSTELHPAELITPAVVVDIAAKAARDPDAVVTVDDVRAFERRHGRIPRDAAVLMYSGWGAKVADADAYRGVDAAGALHFPGFSAEACEWLLHRRGIRSVGVDTLSTDPGISATFDTHVLLARADRYGIENLANLHRVPPVGATLTVGLIPYEQGSGGQARVFATW